MSLSIGLNKKADVLAPMFERGACTEANAEVAERQTSQSSLTRRNRPASTRVFRIKPSRREAGRHVYVLYLHTV